MNETKSVKPIDRNKDKEKYIKHIAVMIDSRGGTGGYSPVHNFIAGATFCFIFGLLFTALIVSLIIFESWWWALIGMFIPLLSYSFSIFIIVRRRKIRNEIFQFLDASQEYVAKAVTESSQRELDINLLPTITRKTIKLEFEFNGEKVLITATGEQSFSYPRHIGHYTDREIRILYSPKYEFILVLKDTAPKFIN